MPAYSDLIANNASHNSHPINELISLARLWQINDIHTEKFAIELDARKVFPSFRERFYYPILKDLPDGNFKSFKIFLYYLNS